jgi:hypothetical protein
VANDPVAYTTGLKFRGNSTELAVMYSDVNKRLYAFTGSATLEPFQGMNRHQDLIDYAYLIPTQELVFLENRLSADDFYHILWFDTNMMSVKIDDTYFGKTGP